MNTPSRLPLVRAIDGLGLEHPLVERVAKLIGDAMADAYRDAEEIADDECASSAVKLRIKHRRRDMTGKRPDTRETAS